MLSLYLFFLNFQFDLQFLISIAIFWLFTWPVVYTKHQATIDSKYNELHSKLMIKLDPLLQKIPGYNQASVEKKNQ
jgi:hypothetical protein